MGKAGDGGSTPTGGAPGDTGSESGPQTGMQPTTIVTPTLRTNPTLSLTTISNSPACKKLAGLQALLGITLKFSDAEYILEH